MPRLSKAARAHERKFLFVGAKISGTSQIILEQCADKSRQLPRPKRPDRHGEVQVRIARRCPVRQISPQLRAQPRITTHQVRRCMHLPAGQRALPQRLDPGADPRLSPVDLLPFADQANYRTPVWMPVHHGQQKRGLGLVPFRNALFGGHEPSGLLRRPGSLRFVEDHDMVSRGQLAAQLFVTKLLRILDEGIRLPIGEIAQIRIARRWFALAPPPVAHKGLAQNVHQRPVTRQKRRRCTRRRIHPATSDVQSGKRLPRARHPGYEHDCFLLPGLAASNYPVDRCCRHGQIFASGPRPRDFRYIVAAEQRLRRLDDGRRRAVDSLRPSDGIDGWDRRCGHELPY